MARILVVDDRPSNRHYLRVVLCGAGHEVTEAADGAQALRATRETRPHLVITDLLMPVMDGFEYVSRLRQEPEIAATPVIFYTATYRSTDAHKLATACGVTEVLPKPTGPRALIDAVNRLLGDDAALPAGAQALREAPSALSGLGQRMAGHLGHVTEDQALINGLLREHSGPEHERERLRGLSLRLADNLGHVQRSASRIFALIELALDLAVERRRDAFLRMFCDASRRIVEADAVALVLLHADESGVRHVEAHGLRPPALQSLRGAAVRQGLIGRVWSHGAALREGNGNDVLAELPVSFGPVRSFLGVPVGSGSAQYGVLLFTDERPGHRFDDEDEMMALALAGEFVVMFELFDANETLQSRAVELELQVAQRQQAEQAQAEALARLDGMIQAAMDAIITVDRSQRIVLFNPAAERMFGRRAADMLGRPLDDLLPEAARGPHIDHLRNFASSGPSTRTMSPLRTVRGRRANGETFPIDASISRVVLDSGTYYTAILRDVTQRVQADQALEQYRVELAGFSQRLLEQEKQTTRRLAQALHDELGQTLAAMRLIYDACSAQAGTAPNDLMRRFDGLISEANQQVRQVLVDLRPPLLDELGLAAALDNELRQRATLTTQGVDLQLDVANDLQRVRWPAEAEYAAFMIAREAVHNALRHARPATIRVKLAGDEHRLKLTVSDDGCGLPIGGAVAAPGHLGMVGMRERALAIGAMLDVQSSPGQGTTVHLRWKEPGGRERRSLPINTAQTIPEARS
ncbi:MAG TPA: response regulator [Ideonella sp.]|uniref:response regulator n=1 Tax=Ideonella sp. TaxID=1929293 RepID=UPI002E3429A8|nr:response regulator [Ideonella sp.]HEX5686084.1 response regulator [Ideonella sp.]